ncbi:Pfu1p RNJ42_02705 [Nakaseomyces bracarensis]|uniref:Pfu1p n=1 Tax=Nakaseomyces bracarensis TaxID=273131 RepID=UPI0038721A7F
MANKSRPKKATVPYRKYVGGQGSMQVLLSRYKQATNYVDEEFEEEGDVGGELEEKKKKKGYARYKGRASHDLEIIGAKKKRTDSVGNDIISEDEEGNDDDLVEDEDGYVTDKKTGQRRKKNRGGKRLGHSKKNSIGASIDGKVVEEEEEEEEEEYIPMRLPTEVQKIIIGYYFDVVVENQRQQEGKGNKEYENIINALLVSKYWYHHSLPHIYRAPKLSSRNFNGFVETVTNAVISTTSGAGSKKLDRYRLGDLVQVLDLSTILQSGKNSNVSKLLRRCSNNLHSFTAPQTSFGYAPLISLKNCHKLRYLDLGLVSETVKLRDLFKAISNFNELTHLAFPRSSIDCEGFQEFCWPNNLQYLKLSGGITNEFVAMTNWPETITTLEFSFCPQVDEQSIYTVLSKIGNNLKHLSFYYPMPSLRDNSLDFIFRYCRNLLSIRLQVDYCTKWLFSEYILTPLNPETPIEDKRLERPLKTIYLDCSGSLGLASKIHPDDFTIALMEGRLPNLKNISVSCKLGWDMNGEDVADLLTAFEEQEGNLFVSY